MQCSRGLARPEVDLDTLIADVVNLLTFEDLGQVMLVGHSYAGAVVAGVADRVPERLSAVIYCDSAPLANGQTMLEFSPPDGQAALRRTVEQQGDGWRMPFPGFEELARTTSINGLDGANRQLMERKAVAQPFGTYRQPLRLSQAGSADHRQVFILCDDGKRMMEYLPIGNHEHLFLDTGHWPMLSTPAELSDVLSGLCRPVQ